MSMDSGKLDTTVIARLPDPDERLAYYVHTVDGKPIFGPKHRAAFFSSAMLETVVKHLQLLQPDKEFEIVGRNVRFKRKTQG